MSRVLRLVQLSHLQHGRHVAVVEESTLRLLERYQSVYELAEAAIAAGRQIADTINAKSDQLSYDDVYDARSDWKILPAFDHPSEPARCLVSGTGLTHNASAASRDAMHTSGAKTQEHLTDSMKMYRAGLEGGRPIPGRIGAMPEWFYKGNGTILRAHGEPLDVPNFADDGGEEAEIAGCYIVGPDAVPYRVGLAQANEFSDHVMEAKGYLHLAPSKLRAASIGPELIVDADFCEREVLGTTTIERRDEIIWQGKLSSGENWMCHSLANLEHHHFKHDQHRRSGDAHVHFLGADAFSFRDMIRLEDGDEMVISFDGFGRPLRNPLRVDRSPQRLLTVKTL